MCDWEQWVRSRRSEGDSKSKHVTKEWWQRLGPDEGTIGRDNERMSNE